MRDGIYILANDRVLDDAIALLSSIRVHEREIAICLIPYDRHYEKVAKWLSRLFDVQVFTDFDLLSRLSKLSRDVFGRRFLPHPERLLKYAAWFGPFERFLYLDCDILVFEPLRDLFELLGDHDFLSYSDQHLGGIDHVFTEQMFSSGTLTECDRNRIFNSGFWASRRGLLSEHHLAEDWAFCRANREYFDFSRGGSDQPIVNYVVLKRIQRLFNLFQSPGEPRMWAGTPGFVSTCGRLVDPAVSRPLRFLHWAGCRLDTASEYGKLWLEFRALHPDAPSFVAAR